MSDAPERWLSELYRASARDEPPAFLDAKILAASRIDLRTRKSRFLSWGAPFAAAAMVVITVSLVTMRDDPALREQSASIEGTAQAPDRRLDVPGAPPLKESAPADHVKQHRAKESQHTPDVARQFREPQAAVAERRAQVPAPAPVVKAEPAEPAAATPSVVSPAAPLPAPEARERASIQAAQSPQATPAPPTPSSVLGKLHAPAAASPEQQRAADSTESDPAGAQSKSRRAAQDAQRLESSAMNQGASPEAWLERITKLRVEGRISEAKQSLAIFRQRYPDYPLPEAFKDF